MIPLLHYSHSAKSRLPQHHQSTAPQGFPAQLDNNLFYPSRANITNQLSDAAVGVGTTATEIDEIQNLAPVTIADQLDQIKAHITQINRDMVQMRHDIARSCVNLLHFI